MIATLKSLFSPSPAKQQAHDAYVAIVAQARRPVFYADWQVADTVDGRFDIIILHLFLMLARCESKVEFCRALSEVFFSDMDRSLREMGASDTGVGKRVKNMAQAFYGRLNAYRESIDDEAALAEALARNVWREQPSAGALPLAQYIRRNRDALQTQSSDALMQGRITFLS